MSNKETIEEAAEGLFPNAEQIGGETYTAYKGFIEGAKWQTERMYSNEEVLNLLDFVNDRLPDLYSRFNPEEELEEWYKVEIVKKVSND